MWKEWLQKQVEWLKSFISEPKLNGEIIQKGSTKRVTAIFLVLSFMWEYHRIVNALMKKIDALSGEQVVLLINTDSFQIPDVPEYWLVLLGGILSLNIIDYVYKKKKTKEEQVEIQLKEQQIKVSQQTNSLHKRITELEKK